MAPAPQPPSQLYATTNAITTSSYPDFTTATTVTVDGATTIDGVVVAGTTALEALRALTTITGTLSIKNASSHAVAAVMTGLIRVKHLTLIGVASAAGTVFTAPDLLVVQGDVHIGNNAALETISFPSLGVVGGRADIYDNSALASIHLGGLHLVSGDLYIGGFKSRDRSLVSIDVASLTTVGGDMLLFSLTVLREVHFAKLHTLGGGLELARNDKLETFQADKLQSIGGDMEVNHNARLVRLGMGSVHVIRGACLVYDNMLLSQVSMPLLRSVENEVYIGEYETAVAIQHLDFFSLQTIGGYLHVEALTYTVNCTWPNLLSVGDNVVLGFNAVLRRFTAPLLATIGGAILITDNAQLREFDVPHTVFVTSVNNPRLRTSVGPTTTTRPPLSTPPAHTPGYIWDPFTPRFEPAPGAGTEGSVHTMYGPFASFAH